VTRRRPHDALILLALWLMVFSASSQVIIVAPILPRIGEELGVPVNLQGLLITAYAVFVALSALIAGPISDRVGRRRILLLGTASLSAALFLHAFAFSFSSLLFFRALAGAAGGMLSGAAVAFVGDYFPYERRGWANGWVMSGIAFGQILGIPLGTILADALGFRWAFLMFAITMGLAAIFIWLVVPQPEVRRDTSQLSIKHIGRRYRSLFGRRETLAACMSYFLMFFSIGLFVTYLPTWLEGHLQVSGTEIASLFFVGGIANVLAGPASGRLSDRIGRKPLVLASCLGMGFVMIATTLVVDTMLAAYILFALAMITVGMRISPLQSLLTALVKDQRRGTLMALAIACGQAGIGLGSLVAGATYGPYGYGLNTFIGAGGIFLIAFIVQTMLPEPARHGTIGEEKQAA
jgi:predicted MFS family arabinose efflux permease